MDIVKLKAVWDQIVQETRDYYKKSCSLGLHISDIIEGREYVADDIAPSAGNAAIESHAYSVQQELFKAAVKAFSPPGGEIVIDKDAVKRTLDLERYPTRFSPDTFWAKLEQMYGGGKAEEIVYQEAAAVLHRRFNLSNQDEVRVVAGTVVLNLRVCVDSFTKKHFKRNELYSSYVEEMRKICKALAAFAGTVNRQALCDELLNNPWRFNAYEITPRQRLAFGSRELEIVTNLGNFEFRLSQQLAEEFQVFISTYGPQTLQEAA